MSAPATSAAAASPATALAAADAPAKPDADAEPVEDDGRLIDRWRDLIDRRGIDGRRAWVALSVGSEKVSWRANRCLRISGRGAGPCPEGQSDNAWQRNFPHRIFSRSKNSLNEIMEVPDRALIWIKSATKFQPEWGTES